MTTPYENFSLWLKSRHGLKAETTYDSHTKDSLASKYIRDAIESDFLPSNFNVKRKLSISIGFSSGSSKPTNNVKEKTNHIELEQLRSVGDEMLPGGQFLGDYSVQFPANP